MFWESIVARESRICRVLVYNPNSSDISELLDVFALSHLIQGDLPEYRHRDIYDGSRNRYLQSEFA